MLEGNGELLAPAPRNRAQLMLRVETAATREGARRVRSPGAEASSDVTAYTKSSTNLGTTAAAESGTLGASLVGEVFETPQ